MAASRSCVGRTLKMNPEQDVKYTEKFSGRGT